MRSARVEMTGATASVSTQDSSVTLHGSCHRRSGVHRVPGSDLRVASVVDAAGLNIEILLARPVQLHRCRQLSELCQLGGKLSHLPAVLHEVSSHVPSADLSRPRTATGIYGQPRSLTASRCHHIRSGVNTPSANGRSPADLLYHQRSRCRTHGHQPGDNRSGLRLTN